MENEIWKDIQNYENLYQISNFGRVKILSKKSGFLILSEKLMKLQLNNNGYYRVLLTNSGKKKMFYVHRLVAEHFIDNPNNKNVVNHIDGNYLNNEISNLEWVSTKENIVHYYNILKNKKRGIYWDKTHKKWLAQIQVNNKNEKYKIIIGRFKNKEKAYQAFYDKYFELYGIKPWTIK